LSERDNPPDQRVEEGEVVEAEPGQERSGYLVHAEYLHLGPLPDARQMEHYERVLEGSANRIMRMAESEVEHRHGLEKRGQFIGAGLPVFFVLLGAIVFLMTGSWAAVALAAVGLTPAGYSFLRDVARGRRGGD
jgi:uncharacterized membrane protein